MQKLHHLTFCEIGETEETASNLLNSVKNRVIVAEKNELIIGYAIFEIKGSLLFWSWLAVLPENQGNGVALLLYQELLACAHKLALKRMMLVTRNRFKKAVRLYLRNGFKISKASLDPGGEAVIEMVKNL